ncbi:heterokaryon incompatibility protein-domain-containing protein [Pisolithus croceorrhizus]|nr:heterokaryon incompatibility protein-domain-containing protein [Pisolithus croceorrhizus]
MRLLDVEAVLDRESVIQAVDPESEFEVLKELDDKTTPYAILSHRWGTEVTYDEMIGLTAMKPRKRDNVRERDGYQKIIKGCEQAKKDGYRWLWIDTCCIDKRSSSELSEAINSMYRWYRDSQMCYAYFHDVDEPALPTQQDFSRFGESDGWPEWFSRGWTLQELIAPKKAEFFNKDWVSIGAKEELTSTLSDITRIPCNVLYDEQALRDTFSWRYLCIAQIMSWAANRKTTRAEDRAYSLLGLFGVNMPLLYGEGSKAFQRLQLEIIRISSDHSIFAWNRKAQLGEYGSVLADDPSCFRGCHDVENVDPDMFAGEVEEYIREGKLAVDTDQDELLSFRGSMDSTQLLRWDVTNLGIQVSLPVLPSRDCRSFYKVILPCRDRHRDLVTINLESRGPHSYHRHPPLGHSPVYTCPGFRSLYLDYSQQPEQISTYKVRLEDGDTSLYGFTRCGTFPREVAGDTVTFSSQGNTLTVLVYANDDARCRFAVGLGYYLDRPWGRVICDGYFAQQEVWSSGADIAKRVYDIIWNAPMSQFPDTTESVHLPQSIFHLGIIWYSSQAEVSIKKCPGCCGEPSRPVPNLHGSLSALVRRLSWATMETFSTVFSHVAATYSNTCNNFVLLALTRFIALSSLPHPAVFVQWVKHFGVTLSRHHPPAKRWCCIDQEACRFRTTKTSRYC